MMGHNVEIEKSEKFTPVEVANDDLDSKIILALPHAGVHIPELCVEFVDVTHPGFIRDIDRGVLQIYGELTLPQVVAHFNQMICNANKLPKAGMDASQSDEVLILEDEAGEKLVKGIAYPTNIREELGKIHERFYLKLEGQIDSALESYDSILVVNGHTMFRYNPKAIFEAYPHTKIHYDPQTMFQENSLLESKERAPWCIGTMGGNSADRALIKNIIDALNQHTSDELRSDLSEQGFKEPYVVEDSPFKGEQGVGAFVRKLNEKYGGNQDEHIVNVLLIEANRGIYERTPNLSESREILQKLTKIVSDTLKDVTPYVK